MTVVAPTPGYVSTIDRRSYSIANDLQKTAGSLADVLRDLPSVQVDMDGNLSLRGDPNVTILVDGKPSALFSGPARAQALQSMPADQFDRVEVMTVPPAGVTAEGSGGVINLVSKAPPKGGAAPTASGTVKAVLGTGDRFDLGASGAYSAQGLSLNGGAAFRREAARRASEDRYRFSDPTTGTVFPAENVRTSRERDNTLTLYGSAAYELDAHDHLDAGLNAAVGRVDRDLQSAYRTGEGAGALALDYHAPGAWRLQFTSLSESVGLTHALPGDGQSVSVKLTLGQNRYAIQNGATYAYAAPIQPDLYQLLRETYGFQKLDLKADYKTTLPNKAKLTAGYEGTLDWQNQNDRGLQGVSAALAGSNPAVAQRFDFTQDVQAIYASYEQTLGKLTLQPGLRLEETLVDTDLVSGAQKGRQAYLEANPSLHLDYDLGHGSELKASYGRRVRRPDEGDLDPFRVESSTTLYTAGNPNLRPAITQSYELGYEFRQKATDLQATLFYRDTSNVFNYVTTNLGDVLLWTSENLGRTRDLGLELVANREILRNVTLSASTDLSRSEVDASNLGIDGVRSAFIASGRVTLNWQVSRRDFIQLSGQASGRQLTAQGYRGGSLTSSLGWRHRFTPRLDALLTADNPFGVSRRSFVFADTTTLGDMERVKLNEVAVFFGFTYALGAPPKHPETFDFGQSPATP